MARGVAGMAAEVGLSRPVGAIPQIVSFTSSQSARSARKCVRVAVDRRGFSSVDGCGIRLARGSRLASARRFAVSSQSHVGLRQQEAVKHHFAECLPARRKIHSTPRCEARDGRVSKPYGNHESFKCCVL